MSVLTFVLIQFLFHFVFVLWLSRAVMLRQLQLIPSLPGIPPHIRLVPRTRPRHRLCSARCAGQHCAQRRTSLAWWVWRYRWVVCVLALPEKLPRILQIMRYVHSFWKLFFLFRHDYRYFPLVLFKTEYNYVKLWSMLKKIAEKFTLEHNRNVLHTDQIIATVAT